MKVLADFLSIILFFATFFLTRNIYAATGAAMIGGLVQGFYTWWHEHRLSAIQVLSLALVMIFGGATLWLHDPIWIKWKPTVLYWIFSLLLGIGLLCKKNFLQIFGSNEVSLPTVVWTRLTLAWAIWFLLLGVLNLWVANHYSLAGWVNFKTFGTTALLLLFILLQGIYLWPYLNKLEHRGKINKK